MSQVRRIAGNTLALGLAKSGRLLISMALSVVLARYLGPTHFGNWNAARSLCALVAIWITLGMDKIAVRECATRLEENERYLGTVLSIKSFFSAGAVLLIFALVHILGYRAEIACLVYIALGIYVFNALGESFVIPFRSSEKMGYEAAINISKDFLLMFLVFLAVYLNWGVVRVAYLYLLGAVYYLVFSWLVVGKRFFRPRLRLHLDLARHLTVAGLPVGLAIFFNSFQDITKLVIQRIMGSQQVGYYSAAAYPYGALESTVVVALMGALFPVLSRLHTYDKKNLVALYRRMSKYLYLFSLLCLLFCLVVSDKVVTILFGTKYVAAGPVLRILGFVIVLMFQNYLCFNAMVAARKEALFALVMGVSAVVNLVFAVWLTKLLGLTGGALALGVTQFILLIMFVIILRREYGVLPLARSLFRPVPAWSLAAAFIWWERTLNFPLGVLLISGTLVYGLGLIVSRNFDEGDRLLWKALLFDRGWRP